MSTDAGRLVGWALPTFLTRSRNLRTACALCASVFICGLVFSVAGCGTEGDASSDVVLYTAIDEPMARAVVEAFEAKTGHSVELVTDTEATKSVGLAERLRAESNRPRADVWWGNDPFYTVGLAEEGLLKPYESPELAGIEEQYVDPEHYWAGNGIRARVFAVPSGSQESAADRMTDLTSRGLADQVVLGRPPAGTTGGHVAALYTLWGQEGADAYFSNLAANGAALVAGNSQSAQQVAAGNYQVGLTDNDDVANAVAGGAEIVAVLPDQEPGGMGTLTIPTTVGLVAGRPDSEAAKELVDFLLSKEVEEMLIEAGFAGYSVRRDAENAVVAMEVKYAEVARNMPEAIRRATALLEGREP